MRETKFIEQNKEKWKQLENMLDTQQHDPERLSELFIQILDDLSYSRTFFPNRSVRVYVNGLAQRIFFVIYKNKKAPKKRLVKFWMQDLPLLYFQAMKDLGLAFAIFLTAMAIGVLSSAMDPEFAGIILGQDYVEMTIENIESGDPMSVYKQKGAFGMSLGITGNNLFVAMLTFVLGFFFTIGSISVIIQNGIMVGAFQYFFIERDLFWESFLTIWVHGSLEIPAIIIAGAAGITLGKGLVFPGTYSRLQSLQLSARRGVKMMVGIVPIIVIAGFIEGFLTRHTDAPNVLRAVFILFNFTFILVYFVWLPFARARRVGTEQLVESKAPAAIPKSVDFSKIKPSGEVFSEIFVFFQKYAGKLSLAAMAGSLVYTAGVFWLSKIAIYDLFYFPSGFMASLGHVGQFFVNENLPAIGWVAIFAFSIVASTVAGTLFYERYPKAEENFGSRLRRWVASLLSMSLLYLTIFTYQWYTFLLLVFVGPFFIFFILERIQGDATLIHTIRQTVLLYIQGFSQMAGLVILITLTGMLFFSLIDTTLIWMQYQLISWILPFDQVTNETINAMLLTFLSMGFIFFTLEMIWIGYGLSYFVLREIQSAQYLLDRINSLGAEKRIKGLEKE